MPWLSRTRASDSEETKDDAKSDESVKRYTAAERLLDLQQAVGNEAVQGIVVPSSNTPAGSAGEPIAQEIREPLEQRLGEDLSEVRVHTDASAAESAESLGANAYTTGRDIYFARGKYAPQISGGHRLLAHELTHVVQQTKTLGGAALGDEVSDYTDLTEREAETVAQATDRGERIPAIAAPGKGIQRDVGWAQRGPLPDPHGTLLLLNAFAAKFLDAAKLIHQNPAAMKLVDEAEAAGIQFGGYSEDGPSPGLGRAYTVGKTVYVPKTRIDPVLAMKSFLFELNNALRAPKFAEFEKEAAKGSKGSLTAKQYAYSTVELEVEGMLRLGEIWFETKKTLSKDAKWDKYDADFYLSEYNAFKSGKKTKDEVVKDVLKRVYDTGTLKGKTVEQFYMEQYESLSGGK